MSGRILGETFDIHGGGLITGGPVTVNVGGQVNGNRSVITSYSIHYTKLYDPGVAACR